MGPWRQTSDQMVISRTSLCFNCFQVIRPLGPVCVLVAYLFKSNDTFLIQNER